MMDRQLAILGLDGHFPGSGNEKILSVNLAAGSIWSDTMGEFHRIGHIDRTELESQTGRLSFSQKSACRRCDRGMAQPLYLELNAVFYQSAMACADRMVIQRWASLSRWGPAAPCDFAQPHAG